MEYLNYGLGLCLSMIMCKRPETTKARGRNRRAFGDLVRLVPVHDQFGDLVRLVPVHDQLVHDQP